MEREIRKNRGLCVVENGILKKMTAKEIIIIPNNVRVILGLKEEEDKNKEKYGLDIFYNSFMYNKDINEVICDSSVEVIGDKAFVYCVNLKNFKIDNIESHNSLKKIGLSAFLGCTSLTKIELPNTQNS